MTRQHPSCNKEASYHTVRAGSPRRAHLPGAAADAIPEFKTTSGSWVNGIGLDLPVEDDIAEPVLLF